MVCMRDMPGSNGICSVLEEAPELLEINDEAVDIFYELLRTANQIQGEKKTTFYIPAAEFRAICEVRQVDEEETLRHWKKMMVLEEVWNENRPAHKKPKSVRKRVRRR